MATVTLRIGGRRYELACRPGEEGSLERLAAVVDAKAIEAGRALGTTNEARQLLLAALLLADELSDARRDATAPAESTEGLAEALDVLARRIERMSDALEKGGPHA